MPPDINTPTSQSGSASLVEINSLTKEFGNFLALDDVTLTIDSGEVFGLLGPNGAGKSTLIRTLLGFLNPTSGSSSIDGFDCRTQQLEVHRRVSYLPGDARLYSMMKAKNVLKLYCEFRETADFETATKIADRFELDLNRWVGLMSTGMRQKLALSIALSADVPLLILDEPTANLDPTVRGQVIEVVLESKAKGTTVVFSSHVLSEIEDSCDRVGILRAGQLVHVESMSSLNRKHRIRAKTQSNQLPEIPSDLKEQLDIKHDRDQVQIETSGELSRVLKWLADASLVDVYVQPVGLRSVYDRFHFPDKIVSSTEANA
ncbi:MAG: ABC transporter ATP-binding protein [Planctomycetota bacterium]